jgi:outer membrane protein assembly factor BamB
VTIDFNRSVEDRPMFHRLTASSLLLCVLIIPAESADWPQFLGLHRNGVSAETGLIDSFPKAGPKELWRVKGGVGMCGVAIGRGKAITMVQTGGKQRALALDAKTGNTLWNTPVAPQYRNDMGDGPRATPTIDGENVYIFTGEGNLVSLNFADGKIRWERKPLKQFGGKPAEYGMACSPLIAGDLVVVTAGTKAGTVVAYHKKDGKFAWKAGDDPTGYSTPALLKVGGEQQIVVFTGGSAIGLAPKTGKQLWRFAYETQYHCNTASPIAVGGNVLISSGENHGSAMLSLTSAGGVFDVKPAWKSFGRRSVLRSEWQTPILHKGNLYGLDNVGSAGPVTNLVCVDAKSGKQRWIKRRFGKSNGIFADGKLWYVTMKGELILVKADPAKYTELARSKPLIGTTRHAPALSDGRLYLRDGKEIVCLDVRKFAR